MCGAFPPNLVSKWGGGCGGGGRITLGDVFFFALAGTIGRHS